MDVGPALVRSLRSDMERAGWAVGPAATSSVVTAGRSTLYFDPAGLEVAEGSGAFIGPRPGGLDLPESIAGYHWDRGEGQDIKASVSPNEAGAGGEYKRLVGWWRTLAFILGGIVAVLIVVGAVLGGVYGSRAATRASPDPPPPEAGRGDQRNPLDAVSSSTTGQLPLPTGTSTSGAPLPTLVRANSALAVTGHRGPTGLELFLFYQGPDERLRCSRLVTGQGRGRWEAPVDITSFAMPGTTLAATTIIAKDFPIQEELFYHDANGQVLGVAIFLSNGDITMASDSIRHPVYQAAAGSRMAAYWPYLVHVDKATGAMAEIRNKLREQTPDLVPQADWTKRTFASIAPGARSRFAVLPLETGFRGIASPGGYLVVYQGTDGRLATAWPDSESARADTRGWLQSPKLSSQPLAQGAAIAGFSVAWAGDASNRTNLHVLHQDTAPTAGGRIVVTSFNDGNMDWRTVSPPALATADSGTDIACLTMPSSTYDELRKAALPIEPVSRETARCYFQRRGAVVEVVFDGTSWAETGLVPIP